MYKQSIPFKHNYNSSKFRAVSCMTKCRQLHLKKLITDTHVYLDVYSDEDLYLVIALLFWSIIGCSYLVG